MTRRQYSPPATPGPLDLEHRQNDFVLDFQGFCASRCHQRNFSTGKGLASTFERSPAPLLPAAIEPKRPQPAPGCGRSSSTPQATTPAARAEGPLLAKPEKGKSYRS